MILKGKVGLSWSLGSEKELLMFSWDIIFFYYKFLLSCFSSTGYPSPKNYITSTLLRKSPKLNRTFDDLKFAFLTWSHTASTSTGTQWHTVGGHSNHDCCQYSLQEGTPRFKFPSTIMMDCHFCICLNVLKVIFIFAYKGKKFHMFIIYHMVLLSFCPKITFSST